MDSVRTDAVLSKQLQQCLPDVVVSFGAGGSLYECLSGLQKCPEEVARIWALQVRVHSHAEVLALCGILVLNPTSLVLLELFHA